MASINDNTNRNVVPNWRDYKTTAESGELSGNKNVDPQINWFPIDDYIKAWEEYQTIPFAGDLISAAIMNGQQKLRQVIEAAAFIKKRVEEVPHSLYETALTILPSNKTGNEENDINLSARLEAIYMAKNNNIEKVKFIRKLIRKFPYNPICYVELSLAYAKLGLMPQAEKAIDIAVHLAPASRYVTRSAARLFLHGGDADRAHWIVANNPAIKFDPWILAAEISINLSRGRSSRHIKGAISLINSNDFSDFSITELASALGTIEFNNGAYKKCRMLMNKALISPNDNSLSQAEWFMFKDDALNLHIPNVFFVKNNFEAEAREYFLRKDYQSALDASTKWIEEIPFAKSPILYASHIAHTFLKDYESAIKILKIGTASNPKELYFKNNLAYVYALSGDTEKADEILNEISTKTYDNIFKAYLIATKGLNEYRKGNIELGRSCYNKVIKMTTDNDKKEIRDKAILNYIREEVRATKKGDNNIVNLISTLYTGDKRETEALKRDIMDML